MNISGIIVFISCFLISHVCSGQVIIEELPRGMFSTHFNFTTPGDPVNKFLKHNQVGYQVEIQYRVQYNKPFLMGAYYNQSTLSKYILRYIQVSGNGDINIKEKANTRRLEGGLTAGFYPEINWLIQPYMQGRVGISFFQTSSILKNSDSNEQIERISEYTTAAPAYGLDIGFHIVPNIWFLRGDVRFGFAGNTSTSYLLLYDENAGTSGYPIDYFKKYTSAGKWLKVSVGVSVLLGLGSSAQRVP